MPKILPTCKEGFELNRENNSCKCSRKVNKTEKKQTKPKKVIETKEKSNKTPRSGWWSRNK